MLYLIIIMDFSCNLYYSCELNSGWEFARARVRVCVCVWGGGGGGGIIYTYNNLENAKIVQKMSIFRHDVRR